MGEPPCCVNGDGVQGYSVQLPPQQGQTLGIVGGGGVWDRGDKVHIQGLKKKNCSRRTSSG